LAEVLASDLNNAERLSHGILIANNPENSDERYDSSKGNREDRGYFATGLILVRKSSF